MALGVRWDSLKWSIAGPDGGTPNTLSELEWSDVLSHQLTLGGRGQIGRYFYGRAQANYAWIQSGSVRDSDYEGDDHTGEYSRSIAQTGGDQAWDVTAGAGYPFVSAGRRFFAAPMLGLSMHQQAFRITHGMQTLSLDPNQAPPVGPLDARLNSLYVSEWQALWCGGDVRYALESGQMPPLMSWELSLKYFFSARYSGEADWNLRTDLQHPVSFEHDADGQGLSLQASWRVRLSRALSMAFTYAYSRWWTDPGTDTVHMADGQLITTRLNEVVWESNSVMLGLIYLF